MSYTPKPGDEVYSPDGELGIYVSPATGGGHIVEPMVEDGDGVNEPVSYYAEGVAIWQAAHRQPPRPMLDQAIAQQQEKLAALRREISEIEQQKRTAAASHREILERLKQHEQLRYVDDFLNKAITHYVLEIEGVVQVLDSKAFSEHRGFGYSERLLTLWAHVDRQGTSLRWTVKVDSGYSDQREIHAFPGIDPAMEKARELVTLKMKKAVNEVAAPYGHSASLAIKSAKSLGMEPLPELLQALRDREIREAQALLDKATKDADAARAALAKSTAAA